MRVFLYEWCTGGGLLSDGAPSPSATELLTEGRAMLGALVDDFAAIAGVEVTVLCDISVLCDHRLRFRDSPRCTVTTVASSIEAQRAFRRHAASSDWTVVIAPETGDTLARFARDAIDAGGRLLGPKPQCIALAGDKHALAEHLASHGIMVPPGYLVPKGRAWPQDLVFPAVAKPCDGAGSQMLRYFVDRAALQTVPPPETATRIERYCPGVAASVAVLCGQSRSITLEPCRQDVARMDNFKYRGGSLPLPDDLATRARRLAQCAVATLPGTLGYLGVDLVLGDSPAGNDDYVIEINPRLTTSYVGLRRAARRQNLAATMLALAAGDAAEVTFDRQTLHFRADGTVTPNVPIAATIP